MERELPVNLRGDSTSHGVMKSNERTFLVARLASLLLLLLVLGCTTPLVHPLRVPSTPSNETLKGLVVEGSMSFQWGLGRTGSCDNFQGCVDGSKPTQLNPLQLSAGYSTLLGNTVGLMAGFYFPAWENLKDGTWYNTLGFWTYVTVQNDYFSVGIGPEIGGSGWALTAGAELQPRGNVEWATALGVYGRIFWPFSYDHREFDGKVRTWELGGRLRVGPVYLQYTYYTQAEGVMYWELWETATYAQGMHIISLGGSFSRDTMMGAFPP